MASGGKGEGEEKGLTSDEALLCVTLHSLSQLYDSGIIPTFRMRKLRFREVNKFAQGHTQQINSNPGSKESKYSKTDAFSTPEPICSTPTPRSHTMIPLLLAAGELSGQSEYSSRRWSLLLGAKNTHPCSYEHMVYVNLPCHSVLDPFLRDSVPMVWSVLI